MKKALIVLWTVCGLFGLGVLVVLISGRGCVKLTAAALKEHEHNVRPTLDGAKQVAEDIKKLPFITESKLDIDGDGLEVVFSGRSKPSTALIVHEEDLASIDELGAVYARVPQSRTLAECAAIVLHGTHPWDPFKPKYWTSSLDGWFADRPLTRCGSAKYLLVVRTIELVKASVIGKECSSTQCKFSSGYVRGEVHVYGLSPVAHLGAAQFEAENGEKVNVQLGTEVELAHQIAKQIASSVKNLAPKAKFDTETFDDE